jgi:hypothetical protein
MTGADHDHIELFGELHILKISLGGVPSLRSGFRQRGLALR